MQLAIIADTTATVANEDVVLSWVTKGGSSIVSKDGRFQLRKNTKGVWRVFDGGILVHEVADKDAAKAYATDLAAGGTLDLKAAFFNGDAKVYSIRADGTMRRRHFLTGNALLEAQNVRDMREAASMGAIAKELHVSVAHVRRMLIDLAITEQLLAAEASELEALLTGAAEASAE